MPDDRRAQEELYYTIDSPGWLILIAEIAQRIRDMAGPLIEDPDLSEAERRGFVYAIRHLKAGVRSVYQKAGRTIPSQIQQELGMNE